MGIPFNDQWRLPRWDETAKHMARRPGDPTAAERGRHLLLADQALRERMANATAWKVLSRRPSGHEGEGSAGAH